LRIINKNLIGFENFFRKHAFNRRFCMRVSRSACVFTHFFYGIQQNNQARLIGSFTRTNLNCKKPLTTKICKEFLLFIFLCVYDLKLHLKFEVSKFCSLKARHALHALHSLALRPWIFKNSSWKSKQTNTGHGEVKLQMKRACLSTQRSESNLTEEIWCGQENA